MTAAWILIVAAALIGMPIAGLCMWTLTLAALRWVRGWRTEG